MYIINILTENTSKAINTKSFNNPLIKSRKYLIKKGIKIKIFWNYLNFKDIYNCDTLIINSKVFKPFWADRKEDIFNQLKKYSDKINNLIWYDSTDSSGTIQVEVFPYVNKYLKSFLLKDRSLYLKKMYNSRIISDFYNKNFNIKDDRTLPKQINWKLNEDDLQKIHLGWNPAVDFYSLLSSLIFRLPYKYSNPQKKRDVNISSRFGINYSLNTIRYQREIIKKMLIERKVDVNKLKKKAYINELKNSKIAISPFGWGEFAYPRDFEIIITGALLCKPDMSHIETWPDIFINNHTYLPFKWDFSDLNDVIDNALDNPDFILSCANNAQNIFKSYQNTKKSKKEFYQKIKEICNLNYAN